jgi:hypothetical protein
MRGACLLLLLLAAALANAATCPTAPPHAADPVADPESRDDWPGLAEPHLARYAVEGDDEPPYGVGYLHVTEDDEYSYDWPRHLVLPLWREPDERAFYGWITAGQVRPVDGQPPRALTGAGLVETSYEIASFIVYEATDGGWLRIRLEPGAGGEVWTHRCHLGLGRARLVYHDWASFLREHADWLHFRAQVPHTLRARPDIGSARVATIGLDHKLVLLEIVGDWMRVMVEQPDRTCDGLAGRHGEVSRHEGWVRWRDEARGPWVWVYTRGC